MERLLSTPVLVQRKFAPMLARQLTGRCRCKLPSSRRRCNKTPTGRTSEHNETNRPRQVRRHSDKPKRVGYHATRLNSTIGRHFHPNDSEHQGKWERHSDWRTVHVEMRRMHCAAILLAVRIEDAR